MIIDICIHGGGLISLVDLISVCIESDTGTVIEKAKSSSSPIVTVSFKIGSEINGSLIGDV